MLPNALDRSASFLGALIVISAAPIICYSAGLPLLSIVAIEAALVCTVYVLARFYLAGKEQSRYVAISNIAIFSIAAVAGVSAAAYLPAWVILSLVEVIWPLPEELASKWERILTTGRDVRYLPEIVIISISAIGIVAIIFMRPRPTSGPAPTSLDLKAVKQAVLLQLTRLEDEASFLPQAFVPIATWVDEGDVPRRRVRRKSLLSHVRTAPPRSLIVLKGEPGSGKSIALRKLAGAIADDITRRQQIPIFLSLRHFSVPKNASREKVEKALGEWVRDAVGKQSTFYLGQSIAEHFDSLYSQGKIIFLFDAFDEIPVVMASHHQARVIKNVSGAIAAFIASSGGCCCVVASREYKSPVLGTVDYISLVVRQFDDASVKKYIELAARFPSNLLKEIYRGRKDLFVMSRNPFLLALLVQYTNANDGKVPDNEYILYEGFIRERLKSASQPEPGKGAQWKTALQRARDLALSSTGIDPTVVLACGEPIDQATRILMESGLVTRVGDSLRFTHRRFLEYFRAEALLAGREERPTLAAGYLDQHRDTLALYGALCSEEAACALASEAVEQVLSGISGFDNNGDHRGYERAIIAMRFVRDAFRSRLFLVGEEVRPMPVPLVPA